MTKGMRHYNGTVLAYGLGAPRAHFAMHDHIPCACWKLLLAHSWKNAWTWYTCAPSSPLKKPWMSGGSFVPQLLPPSRQLFSRLKWLWPAGLNSRPSKISCVISLGVSSSFPLRSAKRNCGTSTSSSTAACKSFRRPTWPRQSNPKFKATSKPTVHITTSHTATPCIFHRVHQVDSFAWSMRHRVSDCGVVPVTHTQYLDGHGAASHITSFRCTSLFIYVSSMLSWSRASAFILSWYAYCFFTQRRIETKRYSTPQRQEPLELAMSMKDARVNQQELYNYVCHPCM